jgi:hypothetical protein
MLIVCGSFALLSGSGYSVVRPVFGSSLPISPRLLPVNQMLPSLSSASPCGPLYGDFNTYSRIAPVFGSRRPSLLTSWPVHQIEPSLDARGSCGREPSVGTSQILMSTFAEPGLSTATGRLRSGKLLIRYSVIAGHSSGGMGAFMFCIMRVTVSQPSDVYPTRTRLMSWQAPHVSAKRCFIGPSGQSFAVYCAEAEEPSGATKSALIAISEKPSFAVMLSPPPVWPRA